LKARSRDLAFKKIQKEVFQSLLLQFCQTFLQNPDLCLSISFFALLVRSFTFFARPVRLYWSAFLITGTIRLPLGKIVKGGFEKPLFEFF